MSKKKKITPSVVAKMKNLDSMGVSGSDIARFFNVSPVAFYQVKKCGFSYDVYRKGASRAFSRLARELDKNNNTEKVSEEKVSEEKTETKKVEPLGWESRVIVFEPKNAHVVAKEIEAELNKYSAVYRLASGASDGHFVFIFRGLVENDK